MHKPDRKEEAREEERIWLIQRDAQKEGLRWDQKTEALARDGKGSPFQAACMLSPSVMSDSL